MTKISELTAHQALDAADLFPVVQDVASTLETRQVDAADLASFIGTQAGDGTEGAPGIAFASDPDTGIYRIGANQLGISAGGSCVLTVDGATGRIGIGETNPGRTLHIKDTTSATYLRVEGRSGFNAFLELVADADPANDRWFFQTNTAGNLRVLNAGSTQALRIDQTGEVAVGTAAPTSGNRFQVATTGQANAMYIADADGTMHFPWDGTGASPNIAVGAGDGLEIWHNGTDGYVGSSVGDLVLQVDSGYVEVWQKGTTAGTAALRVRQDDTDQEFINFVGTSGTGTGQSITTWTAGSTVQGFVLININGANFWMPYYDAPTS